MGIDQQSNPVGRPLTYSRAVTDKILSLYETGRHNLKEAAEKCGIRPSTFFGWIADDVDGISDRYARVQQIRALAVRDEILPIIDDSRNDYVERETKAGTFVTLNSENIRRSELRANYRMKFAAENLPRRLGGSADVGNGAQIVIHLDAADAEV